MFALLSCAKDKEIDLSQDRNSVTTNSTSLTVEEAMDEVEKIINQIDNGNTKTNSSRKILDYYVTGLNKTRSIFNDKSLFAYVFNFEGDSGFAIIAGDKRLLSPILVVSDKGYLNPEEGIDDDWLKTFLIFAEKYYSDQIIKYEESIKIHTRIDNIYTQTEWLGDWYVKEELGRRTYLSWSQEYPFNKNLPIIDRQRSPLGCTATATMLLMAWHQFPKEYQGYQFNWTEMLKHRNEKTNNGKANLAAVNDLAELSEIITRKENLNMHFALSGSSAPMDYIPRTLVHLGYSFGGTLADWNTNTVLNELKNYPHSPIVVGAYAIKGPEGYSNGHAFLLETVLLRERKLRYIYSGQIRIVSEPLVYINYGFNGSNNGYYNAGVFNTNAGPVIPSTQNTRSGENGYYRYLIEMVYGVRI